MALTRAVFVGVLNGGTYEQVGRDHGIGRTATERRVRRLLSELEAALADRGCRITSISHISRVRDHRDEVLCALAQHERQRAPTNREVVSPDELERAVALLRTRSDNRHRDVALLRMLFTTGAKPSELAAMPLSVYIRPDGLARADSEMPREVAFNGKARPMYFRSTSLCLALDAYLAQRLRRRIGLGDPGAFRGLDAHGRLFLTDDGHPFGTGGKEAGAQSRAASRSLIDLFSVIRRRAGLEGATSLIARRTFGRRLRERGATDRQIAELMGVTDLSSMLDFLGRKPRPVEDLVQDLF